MTFKKEISIDGVTVILATLALCVWLVTLKNNQDETAKTVDGHTVELKEIHAILVEEQVKNEATDELRRASDDHEARLRTLEKDADFLRVAH
jgi:hypothetical protein